MRLLLLIFLLFLFFLYYSVIYFLSTLPSSSCCICNILRHLLLCSLRLLLCLPPPLVQDFSFFSCPLLHLFFFLPSPLHIFLNFITFRPISIIFTSRLSSCLISSFPLFSFLVIALYGASPNLFSRSDASQCVLCPGGLFLTCVSVETLISRMQM